MTKICITDGSENINGLQYIKNSVSEITDKIGSTANVSVADKRCRLTFDCPEYYSDVLQAEVADKAAEVIAVGYKYAFFKTAVKVAGLSEVEREILLASLIAADLTEDKKYAFDRLKAEREMALDGVFNFRLKPLRKKWRDIAEYMPNCFVKKSGKRQNNQVSQ